MLGIPAGTPPSFWKGGTARDPPSCVLEEITLSLASLSRGPGSWDLQGLTRCQLGSPREESCAEKATSQKPAVRKVEETQLGKEAKAGEREGKLPTPPRPCSKTRPEL